MVGHPALDAFVAGMLLKISNDVEEKLKNKYVMEVTLEFVGSAHVDYEIEWAVLKKWGPRFGLTRRQYKKIILANMRKSLELRLHNTSVSAVVVKQSGVNYFGPRGTNHYLTRPLVPVACCKLTDASPTWKGVHLRFVEDGEQEEAFNDLDSDCDCGHDSDSVSDMEVESDDESDEDDRPLKRVRRALSFGKATDVHAME